MQQYREFFDLSDCKFDVIFSYNKKTNQIVEIFNIQRASYSYLDPRIIREVNDEDVLTRVRDRIS